MSILTIDTPTLRLWKEIRERREEEDTCKKKRQVLFNGCINRANEFFFILNLQLVFIRRCIKMHTLFGHVKLQIDITKIFFEQTRMTCYIIRNRENPNLRYGYGTSYCQRDIKM